MKSYISSLILSLLVPLALPGQEQDAGFIKALNNITPGVLKSQLGFLSSDYMEGRKAGEKGERISSEYIAGQLQLYGVAPGGDSAGMNEADDPLTVNGRTYFQNFSLIRTLPGEKMEMTLVTREGETTIKTLLDNNIDFSLRYPGRSVEIEAPVVFAGYGFHSEKLNYNDFDKLDVKGKFVVRISGSPGFAKDKLTPSELVTASREAESTARKLGAVGIIEIYPDQPAAGFQSARRTMNSSMKEQRPYPLPVTGNYRLPENTGADAFLRIYVNAPIGDELLKGSGTSLSEYIAQSSGSNAGRLPVIKNLSVTVKTDVRNEVIRVRNVIGIIEGRIKDQFIVLGAHYDHLGAVDGYVWNGADDNGSGTVGVMTIAKAIKETGIIPEKSIIIALWTAEEEGLLGSRYFVRALPFPKDRILLNMNFDMISRYVADESPDKVVITYSEDYPVFRTITENNLRKYNIDLDPDFQPSGNPPGGSDHRSFVEAGIPVFRIKPGHREEYHTPFDEATTVDWDIMEKIVKISFANVWEMVNGEWQ